MRDRARKLSSSTATRSRSALTDDGIGVSLVAMYELNPKDACGMLLQRLPIGQEVERLGDLTP